MSQQRRQGVLGRMAGAAWRGVQRFVREVSSTVTQKVIPQGAAELSQALFSQSNAYVPYGPPQRPAPVQVQQAQHARGFDAKVAEYVSRAPARGRQQERGMSR